MYESCEIADLSHKYVLCTYLTSTFNWKRYDSFHKKHIAHGLRTPREEIAFNARPKIQFQSQIFRYSRSIFCLPHQPDISDLFYLCLHWVSVVRANSCTRLSLTFFVPILLLPWRQLHCKCFDHDKRPWGLEIVRKNLQYLNEKKQTNWNNLVFLSVYIY